jgi:uncharacterized protein (DUF2267 family)
VHIHTLQYLSALHGIFRHALAIEKAARVCAQLPLLREQAFALGRTTAPEAPEVASLLDRDSCATP